MLSLKNFFKSPVTTLASALVGTLQAGIASAAIAYSQTGNVTDWKPYAAAAAAGGATFLLGGLLPDITPQAVQPIAQEIITRRVGDAEETKVSTFATELQPTQLPANEVLRRAAIEVGLSVLQEQLNKQRKQ